MISVSCESYIKGDMQVCEMLPAHTDGFSVRKHLMRPEIMVCSQQVPLPVTGCPIDLQPPGHPAIGTPACLFGLPPHNCFPLWVTVFSHFPRTALSVCTLLHAELGGGPSPAQRPWGSWGTCRNATVTSVQSEQPEDPLCQ